jgi:NADH dehydrogenase
VELAGALIDFAHGIFPDYRNLRIEESSVILVHSRDRILPELSESLAEYAQKRMEQRGVKFRLEARLVDVRPGLVILSDGRISAETLVWTAGTAPNPLLKTLAIEKKSRRSGCRQFSRGAGALWRVGANPFTSTRSAHYAW